MAFAFSDIPYLDPRHPALRPGFRFPAGGWGLTTFHTFTNPGGCRSRLSAGSPWSAWGYSTIPDPDCTPFGSCLSAALARAFLTTARHRFTCVDHALQPLLPATLRLAAAGSPRGFPTHPEVETTLFQTLRTPALPPAHGLVGYWWQNTRLYRSLNCECTTATHVTSCRTLTSPSPALAQLSNTFADHQAASRPRHRASVRCKASWVVTCYDSIAKRKVITHLSR